MLKLKIPYEMVGFMCQKARMILSSIRSPATITAISIIEVNESSDLIVIKAILNVAVVLS